MRYGFKRCVPWQIELGAMSSPMGDGAGSCVPQKWSCVPWEMRLGAGIPWEMELVSHEIWV